MKLGRLSDLQTRILQLLAGVEPKWTLSGGGALAGFHLCHRTTRDLDLFWHGAVGLGPQVEDCIGRLRDAGLAVDVLQRSRSFVRLSATDGQERTVLDLVAEPVAVVEAPVPMPVGEATVLVDTADEILVNQLGALLNRAEARDLLDLQLLLAQDADLARAMQGAAQKDGGFSPLTLGWMLASFPVGRQASAAGMDEATGAELDRFRLELARRVAALAAPDG